jgi:uncharacterized protein YcbX
MTAARNTRLQVGALWRYPVKSLRGEQLATATVTADGIRGDRLVHVRGPRGLLTGRTRHGLLTIQGHTGPSGEPLVDGYPWDSPAAAATIQAAAGPGARLVRDRSRERFDVLPLLVATTAEADRLGTDIRRLRPNLVITGADPAEERDWPGRALAVGDVVLGVHSLRARCIVTTIDPDDGAQDLEVLRRIRREMDGVVALDCWVITGGVIRRGDPVEVLPLPQHAPLADPGGWVTGRPYVADTGASNVASIVATRGSS